MCACACVYACDRVMAKVSIGKYIVCLFSDYSGLINLTPSQTLPKEINSHSVSKEPVLTTISRFPAFVSCSALSSRRTYSPQGSDLVSQAQSVSKSSLEGEPRWCGPASFGTWPSTKVNIAGAARYSLLQWGSNFNRPEI